MVTGKAPNPGVNCLGSSNAWGFPPHRSWPSVTVRLASGSHCRKNTAQSPSSGAGCIRRSISWIRCRKVFRGKAKQLIHEMYLAPTRKAALAAYDQFISSYHTKFPKACECLEKDKEILFTFYDFPAQHWSHLRTTNPIESTFATVRLRTHRTKGCGSRIATLTMVFKLGLEAQKRWRRLNGAELVAKVVTGVKFVDGEEQTQQAA